MSAPSTSFIQLASAAAAAMLLLAGLAFQAGNRPVPAAGLVTQTLDPAVAAPVQQVEAPLATEVTLPQSPAAQATPRPMLAVIMDDVGADRTLAQAVLDIGFPLTVSVLPFADAAPEIARAAGDAGHDVFVHLPMEPVGLDDPGPHALLRSHSRADIAARLSWAFARVPGASGLNNHMGSAMTADRAAMERFASIFGETSLIFVDSLTHRGSVAASAMAASGTASFRRDVFLDHDRSAQAIDRAIDDALRRAVETGSAIAIAHPHNVTLAALATLPERAEAMGVDLVGMRDFAARQAAGRSS